ncbi:MAG: HAMP domain-containing sensor histidine kinase [Anaerolineales bacterium]|nr:HAMP domain-containing sensor histidine kinase [Anaerolineales bacterium]
MRLKTSLLGWFGRFTTQGKAEGKLNLHLRAKVTLGVVLPLVLILGAFTVVEYLRHREVVMSNLSILAAHSGKVIENTLRQQMLKSDFEELQNLLDTIGEREEFRIVYLLDTNGKVIFAPNHQGSGQILDNRQEDCQPCHRLIPEERPASVVVTAADGQRVFRSMQTIENTPDCAQCHDPQQRLIGLVLTDISTAPLESPLSAHLRESLLWWAGTILVTVLVVNLVMSRFVLRRLEGLASAITGFGKGQKPAPIPESHQDEIGQLASAFNMMTEQVEARNTEIQELSEKLLHQSSQRGELLKQLITAQEDERKRVARELHDELGQSLSGIALQTEVIKKLIPETNHKANRHLEQTHQLIKETATQMHDMILALRPSLLDDLGLASALNAHAERLLAGTGITYDLDTSRLKDRLPPKLETALYRIYQEALTNIVRHASASEVKMTLTCQNGTFEGEILDNGDGFEPDSQHLNANGRRGFGLLGMQERIAMLNGNLEILSAPGKGTRVRIQIPLTEITGV